MKKDLITLMEIVTSGGWQASYMGKIVLVRGSDASVVVSTKVFEAARNLKDLHSVKSVELKEQLTNIFTPPNNE